MQKLSVLGVLCKYTVRAGLFLLALLFLSSLLACGSSTTPVQPGVSREDIITQTTTHALRLGFNSVQDTRIMEDFSFSVGNVSASGRVTEVIGRVEGYPNCPEKYAAYVIPPSGRRVPVWEYDNTLPCHYSGTGSNGSFSFVFVLYKEGGMSSFVGESAFGRWTITGQSTPGTSIGNEIKVTLTITRQYTAHPTTVMMGQ